MGVLSIEKQVELVLGEFPWVVWELVRVLNDDFGVLKALMLERAEGVGVGEYGDSSFRKSVSVLERDVLEELADALWYLSCKRLCEKGLVL